MNFLAHYVVAARVMGELPPLAIAGTALPDLLPLAAPRLRLRPAMVKTAPRPPIWGETEGDALAAGARMHLETDAAFHGVPAFSLAQIEVRGLLGQAGFTGMRVRTFFLAHVATELALDACLLRQNPDIVNNFYAGFAAADVSAVTAWTETVTGRALPDLPGVLTRFGTHPYLRHYATDAGVAEGLNRLCRRARQDTFDGLNASRLVAFMGQAVAYIGAYAPALLAETEAALAA